MQPPSECKVTVTADQPPLVVVAGEVSYESAPLIAEALEKLLDNDRCWVALDCGEVEFIDSSGIGTIVHWSQKLKKAGGRLTLQAATSQLLHALQVSGFADQLDIVTPKKTQVEPQRKPTPASVRRTARLSIPLPADQNGLVRKQVAELAQSMQFTEEQIDDIKLAVGEAVSNAIRHGCHDKNNDRLDVDCVGDCDKLTIHVHNPGEPFDPYAIPDPDPGHPREGGMGIFFMRSSMDEVKYTFDETGTTVTMIKYLTPNGKQDDA